MNETPENLIAFHASFRMLSWWLWLFLGGHVRYVVQLRQPSSGSFLLLGTADPLMYEEWVEDILYVQQRCEGNDSINVAFFCWHLCALLFFCYLAGPCFPPPLPAGRTAPSNAFFEDYGALCLLLLMLA